jgi:rhodanese-related sulfurtransferase
MMHARNVLQLVAVSVCLVVLAGCDWFKSEEKKAQKLVVIDANPADIFEKAHIKGAINASLENVEALAKDWNKEDKYAVYCGNALCGTSEEVAKKLGALEFKNVTVYKGGIAEWLKLGYPVEGSNPAAVTIAVEGDFTKDAEALKKEMEAPAAEAKPAEAAPVAEAKPVEAAPAAPAVEEKALEGQGK